MEKNINEIVWNQFGASIDMLIQVIDTCPEGYFEQNPRFYYIAFHSCIFLDYYLTIPPSDFSPLLSFTQKDVKDRPLQAIDDLIPDQIYPKSELLAYLKKSHEKAKSLIFGLDESRLNERFREGDLPDDMDYLVLEILLYNLRHTQHHVGQLNLLLRQDLEKHSEWSFRAGDLKSS